MALQDFWLIGLTIKLVGGFFALLGSFCGLIGVAQNEKHKNTKKWFSRILESLHKSKWFQLPDLLIVKVMGLYERLNIESGIQNSTQKLQTYLAIHEHALFILLAWLAFRTEISIILTIFTTVIMFTSLASHPSAIPDRLRSLLSPFRTESMPLHMVLLAYIFCFQFFNLFYGLFFILSAPLEVGLVIIVLLMPGIVSVLTPLSRIVFQLVVKFRHGLKILDIDVDGAFGIKGANILWAASFSFAITMFSMFFGHLLCPNIPVPQTFQMLISNVIMDSLTLIITMWLLTWAVKRKSPLRIPLAVLSDLTIAAVLACLSLYIGLLWTTDYHLTFPQVLEVLLGRSPSGVGYEFGPYFWTMHTTFIPTLIYLSIILLGWLVKFILLPIRWVFGEIVTQKFSMTILGAVLTFLSIGFYLIGNQMEDIGKYIDKINKAQHQSAQKAEKLP